MLPIASCLPLERRGYIDSGSGQLHFRTMGSGRPLMLVHQAPWSSIQYHRVMPLLAAMGFHVVAFDLPGHGMSDPLAGEPSVAAYADALAAAIIALGFESTCIAGHHGGGLIAGRIAAEYPALVGRLALDNAPPFTEEQLAGIRARFSDLQEVKPDGSHFTDRWDLVRRVGDPDWSDDTVHLSVVTYFQNGPWKEQGHYAAGRYAFEDDAKRIVCPTLSIASRTDPLFDTVQRLRAIRPDWDFAEFPRGAGMAFEFPDEWAATIGGFLQWG